MSGIAFGIGVTLGALAEEHIHGHGNGAIGTGARDGSDVREVRREMRNADGSIGITTDVEVSPLGQNNWHTYKNAHIVPYDQNGNIVPYNQNTHNVPHDARTTVDIVKNGSEHREKLVRHARTLPPMDAPYAAPGYAPQPPMNYEPPTPRYTAEPLYGSRNPSPPASAQGSASQDSGQETQSPAAARATVSTAGAGYTGAGPDGGSGSQEVSSWSSVTGNVGSQGSIDPALRSAGAMDDTMLSLNVSRHQSKLHFRRDENGHITAGAHDFGAGQTDDKIKQMLATSGGALVYHVDTKRIELTRAMTESELEDFHRDARGLGKAVHGDMAAAIAEGGRTHQADQATTTTGIQAALNEASGQSHLHFAIDAGGNLKADAGEIGRLFRKTASGESREAFAKELLGSDMFTYNAGDNTLSITPSTVVTPETIAEFQGNARAVGRAHMGHFDGASSELSKIHQGVADAQLGAVSAGTSATATAQSTEQGAPAEHPASTGAPAGPISTAQPEAAKPAADKLAYNDIQANERYELAQIMGETLMRNQVKLQDHHMVTHSVDAGKHYGFDGRHGFNSETLLRDFKHHNEAQAKPNGELNDATFFELAQKFQEYEKSKGVAVGDPNGMLTKELFDAAITERNELSQKLGIKITLAMNDAAGKFSEGEDVIPSPHQVTPPASPNASGKPVAIHQK